MKKILLYSLSLILVLVSCAPESNYDPNDWYVPDSEKDDKDDKDDEDNVVDESGTLKLMSFNVRYANGDKGTANAWENRRDDLYKMINTEKPLVIGTQECQINQKSDIAANCKEYGAIGVGRNDGANSGETCSIFYHKASCSIEEWGSFWLSETPDAPGSKGWDANNIRIATWARIKVTATGKEFFFINTHLDHKGPTARAEGMKLIMKKFAELNKKKLPQLLTADFNTSQDDAIFNECLKTMKNARLEAKDSDNRATYNGYVGGKTTMIDHIFLSGFDVVKFKTIDQKWGNTQFISDHFPIYTLAKFSE